METERNIIKEVSLEEVVKISILRGKGTPDNLLWIEHQYWNKKGELIGSSEKRESD